MNPAAIVFDVMFFDPDDKNYVARIRQALLINMQSDVARVLHARQGVQSRSSRP